MDRSKTKIIATNKRYGVDKTDVTYVQIRLFMRNNEAEKVQQLVFGNHKLDEFLSLLDVINTAFKRTLLNQSLYNIVILKFFFESVLEKFRLNRFRRWDITEASF